MLTREVVKSAFSSGRQQPTMPSSLIGNQEPQVLLLKHRPTTSGADADMDAVESKETPVTANTLNNSESQTVASQNENHLVKRSDQNSTDIPIVESEVTVKEEEVKSEKPVLVLVPNEEDKSESSGNKRILHGI